VPPSPVQSPSPVIPPLGYLGKEFLLEQEVGRSQTASLYRAIEVESGRIVALKVFQRRISADPRFSIRFREFMKVILEVNHPHLVAVLDYGIIDGRHYIAAEWVEGADLATYLADHGALSAPEATYLARQVCSALEALHLSGLLHSNLKPENILISAGGLAKVSDAGLSGLLSESGLTRTHVIVGRFNYISPEQVRGLALRPASDIYSLGVLLFQILTQHPPFGSRDAWEVLRMHVDAEPPSPDQLNPDIPHDLAMVVLRALQKDPADRFKSAKEMDEALARLGLPSPNARTGQAVEERRDSRLSAIATALHNTWQFLLAPLPAQIFGRQVSFGFLLLVQFLISFVLTFAVLYFLTISNSNNGQISPGRVHTTLPPTGAPTLLHKSRQKTSPMKATPTSWQAPEYKPFLFGKAFLSLASFYVIPGSARSILLPALTFLGLTASLPCSIW
jgi:serine/threonine protein kinase